MARDIYAFSNGLYSDFHRKYDGIAYIDVDSVECCHVLLRTFSYY